MPQRLKMLNFHSSSLFLIIALWSTPQASAQDFDATDGQVSGTITDVTTGLPIAGAQLTFVADPIYATTQADGTYSACLPEGYYTVYISKDGYTNTTLSNVPSIPSEVTPDQDSALSSNAVLPWPFIVPPTSFHTIQAKVRTFSGVPSYGWYWIDGKMLAYRSDPKNKTSPFMFSITPDYRMTGPNSFFNKVSAAAGSQVKDYPGVAARLHGNFVILPNTIPIPPPNVTGLRGDGMQYDYNDIWLFNAFRLSETSNSSADPNQMIGFVHNEDYYGYGGAVNNCAYKSIGVRYSNDLGKSWTRSVPILTRMIQRDAITYGVNGSCEHGTGDMAAAWNSNTSQWVIYAQEGNFGLYAPSPGLVMSVSSDPLAVPGSWSRIDPVTNRTDPGFIGSMSRTLMHGDLSSVTGASPSIIRDSKNNVWHMVYSPWGGGIVYTNSTDLTRWTKPVWLPLVSASQPYPTLIGDEGDALTTSGKVWLWYKGNNRENNGTGYNELWGAELDFGSGQAQLPSMG